MYIAFGNRVVDSKDFKQLIENNSEFKVVKDMSKGSKREDIVAFNLSVSINILNEVLKDDFSDEELNSDDVFEEYLTLAEEMGTDLEEYLDEEGKYKI